MANEVRRYTTIKRLLASAGLQLRPRLLAALRTSVMTALTNCCFARDGSALVATGGDLGVLLQWDLPDPRYARASVRVCVRARVCVCVPSRVCLLVCM